MYSCMTIECIPSSSRAWAACTVLVARQDDGQRDGRDGVLGQDGPDAAHESVGIPHDTSHARGHRQRARRRRDENLARKCMKSYTSKATTDALISRCALSGISMMRPTSASVLSNQSPSAATFELCDLSPNPIARCDVTTHLSHAPRRSLTITIEVLPQSLYTCSSPSRIDSQD